MRIGEQRLGTQISLRPEGTRPQVEAAWDEGSLSQWRQKERTNKGETTGVIRDVAKLREAKGERTYRGRGGINGHVVRGFRGREGRCRAGQGRQGNKRRDMR